MDDRFVNLGEEVILTLLWQSGASESSTVTATIFKLKIVISLSICYWLFKCVLRIARVCVRERDRVTVESAILIAACVCVCVCVWERETGSHHSTSAILIAACLQTHTSIITVSVTRLCSPLGLELMVKLRTLLTVFKFESWSSRLWKGALHFRRGLWCSANHNALCQWPIRADCACRKEGLCRKRSVWERRGIEDLQ